MWEPKVAPLSGVLFALLLMAQFLVYPDTQFMPPEAEVVARLEDGPLRVMVGAYLGLLGAAALLWFTGSVRGFLRQLDDADDRLAALALAGGTGAFALLAVGEVATVAAAERVWVNGAIDPGAATALLDVAAIAVGNGVPVALAVMIGASGIGILRGEASSRWPGWLSVLIALGLLSPFGWAVLATSLLWAAVTGIWIYRTSSSRLSSAMA